jgi:hypothetical protein
LQQRSAQCPDEGKPMPLSGELTVLSLAELIEFFCNQRKSGCLEVVYQNGDGHFYLRSGSLVHASIGVLRGIEAVHYALTLSNASFTFKSAVEAPEQTIDQPWTSVVLEGLRRMDEGIHPQNPFLDQVDSQHATVEAVEHHVEKSKALNSIVLPQEEPLKIPSTRVAPEVKVPAFLSQTQVESPFGYGPRKLALIFAAVILVVAVIAVPWGWYARSKAARLAAETKAAATENSQSVPTNAAANEMTTQPGLSEPAASGQSSPAPGSREVTVQVTYDDNGRVIQASGADAEALRIARQRRFPAGKAGSATITIPIN